MLNRVHFKRLSLDKQTKLVQDLNYTDTVIVVEDASNFDIPNPAINKPGIVEIRGERIEYFTKNGNTLGQLRRGTLGTGTPRVHRMGAFVQDIGSSETIPYVESNIVETVVSDGTNVVPINFVPSKSTESWTYSTSFESTIPTGYGQSNDIEVFVGGVRLKKKPYKVYDINLGPDSPTADVQYDAEFAVNGTDTEVRLTNAVPFGTSISVVQRTGKSWDQDINIQNDDGAIAKFLKAKPGIWYDGIGKYPDGQSTFDSATGTFDSNDITFDQG